MESLKTKIKDVLKGSLLPVGNYSLLALIVLGLSVYAMLSWRDLSRIWAYYKSR